MGGSRIHPPWTAGESGRVREHRGNNVFSDASKQKAGAFCEYLKPYGLGLLGNCSMRCPTSCIHAVVSSALFAMQNRGSAPLAEATHPWVGKLLVQHRSSTIAHGSAALVSRTDFAKFVRRSKDKAGRLYPYLIITAPSTWPQMLSAHPAWPGFQPDRCEPYPPPLPVRYQQTSDWTVCPEEQPHLSRF